MYAVHMVGWGFLGGSDGTESALNAGDLGFIPGLEDPLEKGMATHSSILDWRIPGTELPGGLQSIGLQRVAMTEQLTFSLSYTSHIIKQGFGYLILTKWRRWLPTLYFCICKPYF